MEGTSALTTALFQVSRSWLNEWRNEWTNEHMYEQIIYLSYSSTRWFIPWGKFAFFSALYPSQCQTWHRYWTQGRIGLKGLLLGGACTFWGALRTRLIKSQCPSEADQLSSYCFCLCFSTCESRVIGLWHANTHPQSSGCQLGTQGKPCPVPMTSSHKLMGQGGPHPHSSSPAWTHSQ